MTDPDQCIICLEPLVIQAPSLLDARVRAGLDPPATATAGESPTATSTTTCTDDDAANLESNSRIATLDSCDHIIHDSCIRLWAQKTNTCPICREAFRKLRVLDGVSGTYPRPHPSPLLAPCPCVISSKLLSSLARPVF